MVGLEFILDVQSRTNLEYHCVLCGDTINRIRHVIDHLTSHRHRLNYLVCLLQWKIILVVSKKLPIETTTKNLFLQLTLFPKVFDEVSYLIDLVCDGIEDRFGRSKFRTLEKGEFLENEKKLTEMMLNSQHINNTVGCLELIQRVTQKPVRWVIYPNNDQRFFSKAKVYRREMKSFKLFHLSSRVFLYQNWM